MHMKLTLIIVSLVPTILASVGLPSTPNIKPYPKCPSGFNLPSGKKNSQVCQVSASLTDSGPSILAAAHKCNNGGTVYFPQGDYVIATALDLTFLNNIDFAIYGNISFKHDVDWWPSRIFNYTFQSASFFWRFGGKDVNIYGGGKGVIDGRGQLWWSAMTVNSNTIRPILFGVDGLHRARISGLTMLNPPNWFNLIANSTDVLISNFIMTVNSTNSSAPAKNTDGWDTYRSSRVVIQNSVIVNTDDCVSFKPNSTDMVVQGLSCTGSHGISVGSLGQYQGEVDYVEDVHVYNVTMTNAGDVARIKIWPGVPPGTTGSTTGGGSGLVRNITYEKMISNNNDEVLALTQCYYAANQTVCNEYPSELVVENVSFTDFSGTTSSKYDPRVGSLVCSSTSVCHNISASNINVVPKSGKNATYQCVNMDTSLLHINCV